MKTHFLLAKVFILSALSLNAGLSFSQSKTVHFIFDSNGYEPLVDYRLGDNDDYYEEEIIRHKNYLDSSKRVKSEFIKVHPKEFIFYQYDLKGNVQSTGLAKQDEKPFQVDKIDVYDSLGQVVGLQEIERYKFSKEDIGQKEQIADF